MAKSISQHGGLHTQPGEMPAREWDFMALLNKDIREIEFTHSLRMLGNIRVMEWDFRTVLPAVQKLANQEVDLIDWVRRTAHYKILDWDFRSALGSAEANPTSPAPQTPLRLAPPSPPLSQAEMQALMIRLKEFLQYAVVQLIDEPGRAQLKVQQIAANVLRFKLVLVQRDVAMLIGREGHTAAAIRNILKAAAGVNGVHALLQIDALDENSNQGLEKGLDMGPDREL